jgi:hypothetical protein
MTPQRLLVQGVLKLLAGDDLLVHQRLAEAKPGPALEPGPGAAIGLGGMVAHQRRLLAADSMDS